jgi:hypothetical protein
MGGVHASHKVAPPILFLQNARGGGSIKKVKNSNPRRMIRRRIEYRSSRLYACIPAYFIETIVGRWWISWWIQYQNIWSPARADEAHIRWMTWTFRTRAVCKDRSDRPFLERIPTWRRRKISDDQNITDRRTTVASPVNSKDYILNIF